MKYIGKYNPIVSGTLDTASKVRVDIAPEQEWLIYEDWENNVIFGKISFWMIRDNVSIFLAEQELIDYFGINICELSKDIKE